LTRSWPLAWMGAATLSFGSALMLVPEPARS
jgi:hypothetical protein